MKQYVDVICMYQRNGQIKPLSVLWNNGCEYRIDRITQVVPATSSYSGHKGLRFTCMFGCNERYLFLDEGKWFIEQVVL